MSHITFYIEDDDHKPVDFKKETRSFTCHFYNNETNLDKARPENDTESLLLTNIEKCETLIKQTHRKAEETLELNLPNQEKQFFFNHLLNLVLNLTGSWDY